MQKKSRRLAKKQVWRITRRDDGKSEGDYVALADEVIDPERSLYMFHPNFPYINKTVKNFEAKPFYQTPPLADVQAYATRSTNALWDEYRRILNPQDYPVDLSQRVWDNKMDLIKKVKSAVADREE